MKFDISHSVAPALILSLASPWLIRRWWSPFVLNLCKFAGYRSRSSVAVHRSGSMENLSAWTCVTRIGTHAFNSLSMIHLSCIRCRNLGMCLSHSRPGWLCMAMWLQRKEVWWRLWRNNAYRYCGEFRSKLNIVNRAENCFMISDLLTKNHIILPHQIFL